MSELQMPIGEEDLHAYVDGTLSGERRAEVERALEQNPELAARVSDYFSLNSMFHQRYDRVLSEPLPKRLQTPAPRRSRVAANWPRTGRELAALRRAVRRDGGGPAAGGRHRHASRRSDRAGRARSHRCARAQRG